MSDTRSSATRFVNRIGRKPFAAAGGTALWGAVDELRREQEAIRGRLDERLKRLAERTRVDRQTAAQTATRVTRLERELQRERERSLAALNERLEALESRMDERIAELSGRLMRATGAASEIHDRDIDPEHMASIIGYWGPLLELELDARHLQAWLHRVRAFEVLAVGRLATNLEDILIRSLAARAVASDETEICEIGTLFGIGGLIVRDSIAPFASAARLTIIDPLAGYYGPDRLDPPTGLVVDRRTLDRNIALFAPGDGEVRVLEGFSTDDEILRLASDRTYRLLIIDGDHSYDGVRLDFERYADLVDQGGILVVDDYGAPAWPDVTRYTDEAIIPDDRFELIGAASRTALLRRR